MCACMHVLVCFCVCVQVQAHGDCEFQLFHIKLEHSKVHSRIILRNNIESTVTFFILLD